MNKKEYIIVYLDAHFFSKERLKGKGKFVVLDELKVLKDMNNTIIIIHDFDNNLGHITYDGQPLNLDLLRKDLLKVNPNFKFYTNELSSCQPKPLDEALDLDEYNNLLYAYSKPEKTYRGILYCLQKRVKINGLKLIK
jgi:hypothetical protein